MIDASALQMVLAVLTGWVDRQERQALAYLMEENRVLRRQLGQQRLQFTDADRRRLAVRGHRLGRQVLRQIATIVTPDTILRWHRQLIVRTWTYTNRRSGRHGVLAEIRCLVVRMAEENPTWGYARIQGALKNVGHRVGRSTIARILKMHGVSPVPAPFQAPNANAYAERFVRSIKHECLDRMVPTPAFENHSGDAFAQAMDSAFGRRYRQNDPPVSGRGHRATHQP